MKLWTEPILSIIHIQSVSSPEHDLLESHTDVTPDISTLVHSLTSDKQKEVLDFLNQHSSVTKPHPGLTHLTTHRMETLDVLPIALSYYRCPEVWKKQFKQELPYLIDMNFIEHSLSPWAVPMFAVPKKNGSIHLVVGYLRLNLVTVSDPPYSMPRVNCFYNRWVMLFLFSTLDLQKGYYQVPVHNDHILKTAFVTQFGKYQFRVMPFGLKNAPATFQCLMDNILAETTEYAVWYIDDVCVFSASWAEHLLHINIVLTKLEEAALTLQLYKCLFGTSHCEFLGHHVGGGKLSPQQAKIDAA